MDTVTYPDPRVVSFVRDHFVAVKLPVKKHANVAAEYFVVWTPAIILADNRGKAHDRIEGYLEPELLIAHLSLGLGKYWLHLKKSEEAAHRFEEVAQRHMDSEIGAEALYWLGVADYRRTKDPKQLHLSWDMLAARAPNSEWARRTQVPSIP